jgi:hypothetical protein
MMDFGQEDRQLIFSIFRFYHPSRKSHFTRRTHLRRSLTFHVPRFWTIYATRFKWNCPNSVGCRISWRSNFAPAGFRSVRSWHYYQKGWRQTNSATFSPVMRAGLCLSIRTPRNGTSLARMYQKEWDSRLTQKSVFIVIWGVEGFHVVDLITSQPSFNSEYFVSHLLAPMAAKVFPRGNSIYSSTTTSLE